ncbi:MAG: alpha-glucan phosphorylase [Melioribacteraceae bacterium]|nr:MAG: alpha-glucan phosphorylase [Melioribacteraceae bacterium]
MVNFIGTFSVIPSLPKKLETLREIAYNLYWTWNHDARELFRRMDGQLWEDTNHNPVLLLGRISQDRLGELENDYGFISHLNRVYVQLNVYLQEKTWYSKKYGDNQETNIAYFSAEFGLTECLQIYSGGLGILSGDHVKSASDLGLPFVAVGLCYKEGYFQQYLASDGWQQEKYTLTDFYNQPMELVTDDTGRPIKITLDFPGRVVFVQVWRILVGRVTLYLLDTNVAENSDGDKKITRALYGGNMETRIQQEILLGIGGIRALHALGIKPKVCHMNEGHSAFLGLERIRYLMQYEKLSYEEAKTINFYSNIFTTHTPVPAGIDVFSNDLVEKYFGKYYREELKISDTEFYKLGTIIRDEEPANFNMAHLAMNTAGFVNGVSKLHGEVSKKLWVDGFKNIPFDEIPIDYVTNGIHTHSHISNEMQDLLLRYLGDKIIQDPSDIRAWSRIDEIPDEELWRTHERRRERLVAFARRRLRNQIENRGGSPSDIEAAKEVLNASALTIGFARRFATYKRANLIFKDLERLVDLMMNPEMPLQLIIAGKAHPRDEEGKKLIQEIYSIAQEENMRKRIVFLENYDMNIARYMVEGCDVWLNNPRRPLEASGTSGMKIIANGGLNFSVLDGWWDEGYDRYAGWRIGSGEEYEDSDYQDEIEARQIYETLEKEIIPRFYQRGEDKLPRGWIEMMKASMIKLGPEFNTNRMVQEYTDKFYIPSYSKRKYLSLDNYKDGKELALWKIKIFKNWSEIKFLDIASETKQSEVKVGAEFSIKAKLRLGGLSPEDVDVQIYYGKADDKNKAHSNEFITMELQGKTADIFDYIGVIDCEKTGNFGFTLRVLPKHEMMINPFEMGLIAWA